MQLRGSLVTSVLPAGQNSQSVFPVPTLDFPVGHLEHIRLSSKYSDPDPYQPVWQLQNSRLSPEAVSSWHESNAPDNAEQNNVGACSQAYVGLIPTIEPGMGMFIMKSFASG